MKINRIIFLTLALLANGIAFSYPVDEEVIDEAKAGFESIGGGWDAKQQADYDSCDINGDGKVSFEEFLAKNMEE
jgi:hypothetical protein